MDKLSIVLDQQDMVSMVMGTSPYYSEFQNPLVKPHGSYNGSQDRWEWDRQSLFTLDVYQLLKVYQICRKSWQ